MYTEAIDKSLQDTLFPLVLSNMIIFHIEVIHKNRRNYNESNGLWVFTSLIDQIREISKSILFYFLS